MDPALLELAINDRISKTGRAPKAIILVHLFGMPAKVNEIILIARKYGIALIEDAAEALGSTYQGKHLGTFGDMGVYSFSGNKIITTSAGGALVSENKAWIEKARFLSSQAREPALHYEHKEIGYNYRLSNVCAGIGLGQLKVLHERVMQRRAVYEFYKTVLGNISSIEFIPEPSSEYFSNRWLTTVLFKNHSLREKVRLALEKENIESRPLWKPMHLQPVFQSNAFYGNGISDLLFEKGLCFPSGSNMSVDDLRKVTDIVKSEVQ
jgi:dTDP-4-amino-4,6-dideoxygalactose transaminase